MKKKITSTKIQISYQTFFSWVIWSYKNWTYWFSKDFYEKSAQTDLSKEMWVSISKGLKHLNTVLYYTILHPTNVSKHSTNLPVIGGLMFTALHCTALHYPTLHCTTGLDCTALHYLTALQWPVTIGQFTAYTVLFRILCAVCSVHPTLVQGGLLGQGLSTHRNL